MNKLLVNALNELPIILADYLKPIVEDKNFSATISVAQFNELMTLTALSDSELRIALLPLAASYSYSPISNFCVGAIARGLSGILYFGANIELPGSPLAQAVHAEQSAISHAWMKGEKGIQDITINYSPCGHCRQFMNELSSADKMMVQLPNRQAKTLQEYLPESFGPKDLNIKTLLMEDKPQKYAISDNDLLLTNAVAALNISHAPYSENYCGIAVQLDDQSIYIGAYAENAAFNPSLPPLQVALIQILLAGKDFAQISTVVLVELEAGKISHKSTTQSVLDTLELGIQLNYLTI